MRTLRSLNNYAITLKIGLYKESNYKFLAINISSIDEFLENVEASHKLHKNIEKK